jgi:peptidoglycan/LPS O-acetylase OafA/YrhL
MAARVPNDVRVGWDQAGLLPSSSRSKGYIEMVSLFRIVACATVLGNHAFIWTGMTGNVIGTGFITMLHLSRNAFFFLSGLVVCYSQLAHPRSLRAFWQRRYVQLGVPYLAWTGLYLVFKLVMVSFSWEEVRSFLGQNLLTGYSQLYAAVVIFQYYLVFPLLLRLLRATRRHGLIMTVSLAFALLLGLVLHYPSLIPALTDVCRAVGSGLPWSRDLLTYQEFFVAGALVAFHFDEVREFVSRRYRQIFLLSGLMAGAMVLWYAIQINTGTSTLAASDPYQSAGVIWYFAAIAAIFALSLWWEQRTFGKSGRGALRDSGVIGRLAALTGGVWLCHNVFLTTLRAILQAMGLRSALPWEATVVVLFFGTVVTSVAFVSLVLRTRFRWVLGGPVRSEQRAEYQEDLALPSSGNSVAA